MLFISFERVQFWLQNAKHAILLQNLPSFGSPVHFKEGTPYHWNCKRDGHLATMYLQWLLFQVPGQVIITTCVLISSYFAFYGNIWLTFIWNEHVIWYMQQGICLFSHTSYVSFHYLFNTRNISKYQVKQQSDIIEYCDADPK